MNTYWVSLSNSHREPVLGVAEMFARVRNGFLWIAPGPDRRILARRPLTDLPIWETHVRSNRR